MKLDEILKKLNYHDMSFSRTIYVKDSVKVLEVDLKNYNYVKHAFEAKLCPLSFGLNLSVFLDEEKSKEFIQVAADKDIECKYLVIDYALFSVIDIPIFISELDYEMECSIKSADFEEKYMKSDDLKAAIDDLIAHKYNLDLETSYLDDLDEEINWVKFI